MDADLRREYFVDAFEDAGIAHVLDGAPREAVDQVVKTLFDGFGVLGEYEAPAHRGPDPRDAEIARLRREVERLRDIARDADAYREHVADRLCTSPHRISIGANGVVEDTFNGLSTLR